MFTNNFSGKDADFSHFRLATLSTDFLELERYPPSKSNFRPLFAGVIISLFFHILLIFWEVKVSPALPETKRLTVSLIQPVSIPTMELPEDPVELNSDDVGHIHTEEPITENPLTPKPSPQTANPIAPADEATLPVEEAPKPFISLTPEDIRELRSIQPSVDLMPRHGSISENVFNPALRKRLQVEESKPILQRADSGPKTHMDPSGATVVDLGNGKCLRSSALKAGEVQNWYMTTCGGKSESEQIMERVDQAVNGRLYFE